MFNVGGPSFVSKEKLAVCTPGFGFDPEPGSEDLRSCIKCHPDC